MADFMDIKTSSWAAKGLIVSVILVLVGGGLTIYNQLSGGVGAVGKTDTWLKCEGESCGFSGSFTSEKRLAMNKERNEQYIAKVAETNPEAAEQLRKTMDNPAPLMDMGQMSLPRWGTYQAPYQCPKCGQDTLIEAVKCPKCGNVFSAYDAEGKRTDLCPKCKYSPSAEAKKALQEQKAQQRASKKK